VTPSRSASPIVASRCWVTIALVTTLCVSSACGKKSASPTAPSETVSTPFSIEGVVRHRADGQGLPGARVEVTDGANKGVQASADHEGRYRLNELVAGSVVLRAVADGYVAATQSLTLNANETLDFSLDQSTAAPPAAPERFTVSGSVTSAASEDPVDGASVRVVTGADTGTMTETDASGRYTLTVRPGPLTLEVSAPSYHARTRSVSVSGNHVLDFELEPQPEAGPDPASSGPVVRGTIVNGVSNTAVAGARVDVEGTGPAMSAADGVFEVRLPGPDTVVEVTISSVSTVERSTRVRVSAEPATLTLIPKSLNLTAFDQMFRSDGALRRWTTAPSVVIHRRVLQFTDVDATSAVATSVELSDAEVDSIMNDLQNVLSALTGQTFDRFSGQTIETAADGESVSVARSGVIFIAHYQGLTDATTYWGYTRWAWNDRGEVRAASVKLDRAFETSGSPYRPTLRAHELGHALGYSHVDARPSVMNASGRVSLTDFDRHGARIAFLRPLLNMSPDIDPDPITVNRAPSAGLTWTGAR
jgi:hypothetical protein